MWDWTLLEMLVKMGGGIEFRLPWTLHVSILSETGILFSACLVYFHKVRWGGLAGGSSVKHLQARYCSP